MARIKKVVYTRHRGQRVAQVFIHAGRGGAALVATIPVADGDPPGSAMLDSQVTELLKKPG